MMPPRRSSVLLAVLLTVAVGGCDSSAAPPGPTTTTSTATDPTHTLFPDEGLRPVRMTSGHALGYVQDETMSQILCQVVDKERWAQLLAGRVGRRPSGSPGAGCQVGTEHGVVTLQFQVRDFTPSTTVGGRPATMERNSFGMPVFTVALTDDVPRQLVRLEMVAFDAGSAVGVGTRVLDAIVPPLAKDGERLPEIGGDGRLRYVSTPLTGQFIDLPKPVQALQLCTLLQEEPGIGDVEVFEDGMCRGVTEPVTVSVDHVRDSAAYTDDVAGRPATKDAEVVTVRLRDDSAIALRVSAPDPVGLAERLVPLLTR